MNPLAAALAAAVDDLEAHGIRWALVGGLAVAVRAEPRLTRDADVAVSVGSDEEAEQVVAGLVRRGHRVIALVEQESTGRLATARLGRGGEDRGPVLDLLFASCGIEPEIVATAEPIEVLPGLTVPVASIGHLIVMKLLARDDRRRPADADDLAGLASVAGDDDWRTAATGAALVEERGFARGRDLLASLEVLRANGAYA